MHLAILIVSVIAAAYFFTPCWAAQHLPGWDLLHRTSAIHIQLELAAIIVLGALVFAELVAYRHGQREKEALQLRWERAGIFILGVLVLVELAGHAYGRRSDFLASLGMAAGRVTMVDGTTAHKTNVWLSSISTAADAPVDACEQARTTIRMEAAEDGGFSIDRIRPGIYSATLFRDDYWATIPALTVRQGDSAMIIDGSFFPLVQSKLELTRGRQIIDGSYGKLVISPDQRFAMVNANTDDGGLRLITLYGAYDVLDQKFLEPSQFIRQLDAAPGVRASMDFSEDGRLALWITEGGVLKMYEPDKPEAAPREVAVGLPLGAFGSSGSPRCSDGLLTFFSDVAPETESGELRAFIFPKEGDDVLPVPKGFDLGPLLITRIAARAWTGGYRAAPTGDAIVYLRTKGAERRGAELVIATLDSTSQTREAVVVPNIALREPLFNDDDTLMAVSGATTGKTPAKLTVLQWDRVILERENVYPDSIAFAGDPEHIVYTLGDGRVVMASLHETTAQIIGQRGTGEVPVVSPDGRQIAYMADMRNGRGNAYLVDLVTAPMAPRRIVENVPLGTLSKGVQFSPDGRLVLALASADDHGDGTLVIHSVDLGKGKMVGANVRIGTYGFSSGGSQLAFLSHWSGSGGDLWIEDVPGPAAFEQDDTVDPDPEVHVPPDREDVAWVDWLAGDRAVYMRSLRASRGSLFCNGVQVGERVSDDIAISPDKEHLLFRDLMHGDRGMLRVYSDRTGQSEAYARDVTASAWISDEAFVSIQTVQDAPRSSEGGMYISRTSSNGDGIAP